MKDAKQIEQENQDLKEKIAQIEKELNNKEKINIENLKPSDFQIIEDDIPEIKQIKENILKGFDTYGGLIINLNYITKQLNSLCKEKKINTEEFSSIKENFEQTKIGIEKNEKQLFYKIAEDSFKASNRKQGKIKSLLVEDHELRLQKIRLIEELRVKKELISQLRYLVVDKNRNKSQPKDEDKIYDYNDITNSIRSKNFKIASSRQKIFELQMKIDSLDFFKSIPEKFLEDIKFQQIKNRASEIIKNQRESEAARRMSNRKDFYLFLEKLTEEKNELNKKRSDFYKNSIQSFCQEMEFYVRTYQIGKETKESAISSLQVLFKAMKKFREEVEKKQKKDEAINTYLQEENQVFKESKDIEQIKSVIDFKNDQYKITLENMKSLKYIHQSEINKICYILNIPLMSLNESPKNVYLRILNAINEMKIKNENQPQTLENTILQLKNKNKQLMSLLNND